MSDFEKSISRRPNRKKILRDTSDAYKAVIRDLSLAGDRLENMRDSLNSLEDGERISYSFLLSKQLDLVEKALKWVLYTTDQVFPAWERRHRG